MIIKTHIDQQGLSDQELIKATKQVVGAGIENICINDKGFPIFHKFLSKSYIAEKRVFETSSILMNNFNVEFASTISYLTPCMDNTFKGIKNNLKEIFKKESDFPILSEEFSNLKESKKIFKKEKDLLEGKNLFFLTIPYLDTDKKEYKNQLLSALLTKMVRDLFFIENKCIFINLNDSTRSDIIDFIESNNDFLDRLNVNFKIMTNNKGKELYLAIF